MCSGQTKNKQSSYGFTIVELLIVIVVIGILAAVVVVAYNGIQTRARDTDRDSDLSVIKKKLELFYVSNGYYPNSGQVLNATYRQNTLELPTGVVTPPASSSTIGYCWASTVNQYCYVATRPTGSPSGDCTGASDPIEQCIKYRVSYRKESDSSTMQIMYSPNW